MLYFGYAGATPDGVRGVRAGVQGWGVEGWRGEAESGQVVAQLRMVLFLPSCDPSPGRGGFTFTFTSVCRVCRWEKGVSGLGREGGCVAGGDAVVKDEGRMGDGRGMDGGWTGWCWGWPRRAGWGVGRRVGGGWCVCVCVGEDDDGDGEGEVLVMGTGDLGWWL